MSTTSDLNDLMRRRSVASRAELAIDATMAAMLIRATSANPDLTPRPAPLEAIVGMLNRIDQLAQYRDNGHLVDLVNIEVVTRASLELVQVMARAAQDDEPDADAAHPTFRVLDSLIGLRASVHVDSEDHRVVLGDVDSAIRFADELDNLGTEVLDEAVEEDRGSTKSYAVL